MLSPELVDELIARAIAGEAPFDTLVNVALFPAGPPELWRDWPTEARQAWDQAEHRYTETIRALREDATGTVRQREFVRPTLQEAWRVVEESSAHADPSSRLTWIDLSLRLGALAGKGPIVTIMAAQYQLQDRLGFRFRGHPGSRQLVAAPCVECGEAVDVEQLYGHSCHQCTSIRTALTVTSPPRA